MPCNSPTSLDATSPTKPNAAASSCCAANIVPNPPAGVIQCQLVLAQAAAVAGQDRKLQQACEGGSCTGAVKDVSVLLH
jgi:hypothetical protein